jgi:type I restriction enzyme, S subunit
MAIDEKIAQLTQKCKLLAQYKKGVMQKIFSQELRFKDDGDRDFPDWEEKELGKITNYTKGFAFKSEDYQLSGTRIVRVSDLNSTTIKQDNQMVFIDPLKVVDFEQYKLNQGDIVITTVGSKPELIESAVGRGILIRRENEGLLNQNMLKLNQSKDIESRFLFSQINSNCYIDHIKNIQRGNANQSNITVKDLMKFQVFIPALQEQTKIANFLTSIDEKITEARTYLETVKQYKQGLLQQMFV